MYNPPDPYSLKTNLFTQKQEWLAYFLVAVLCLLARGYLVAEKGLIDYDSVRNYEILRELAAGNFKNLFHHASPGFFLLFLPFTFLFKEPGSFIYVNIFFGVGAVLLLIRFFRQHLVLPVPEAFLTGLLFGLSVFAVHNSRDLSIESISLFLFVLLLDRYYKRISRHDKKAFFQAVTILAVGLTVNYKLILVLPVALIIELLQRDGLLTPKILLKASLILLGPFIFFAGVAIILGQPFYRFPAAIVSINNFTQPNPALRTGRFNLDILYYFRYIMQFEWPLLLPALLLYPVLFRRELFKKINQRLNIYQFLFLIVFLYLGGMQLVLKAPRGLAFIYGILYFIFYLVLKKLIPNRPVIIISLGLAICYQLWQLPRAVYAYANSAYPAVVTYLGQKNIHKIATTVGRGLVPLAHKKGVEVKVIFSECELPDLKKQGFKYVLLDEYYQAANIQEFNKTEKLPAIKTWQEPTLTNPLLYLDHSEFTGLSYLQTLDLHQKATRDTIQLRLVRIP